MTTREMIDTLTAFGPWAHGGRPELAASGWEAAGFAPDEAHAWLGARCFEPGAARELAAAGITSERARERVDFAGYTDTIGYAVANCDLSAEDAAALLARRRRAAVAVELDSAVGPRVLVRGGADHGEILAALPPGWTIHVDAWSNGVQVNGGWSYPLSVAGER